MSHGLIFSQLDPPSRAHRPAHRQAARPPAPASRSSVPAAAMARGRGSVSITETKHEDIEGMCLIYSFILGKLLEMPNPV